MWNLQGVIKKKLCGVCRVEALKNRHCVKSPTPETQCAEGIFQIQYPICAVNFTNKISRSSWTWQNFWKLLTINFRNKYFHNSVDWSRFYLQVYIRSWLAIGLTINPPCKAVLQQIYPKQFVPHLPWIASLHTLWGGTLCPCSIGKSCWDVSLNICKKEQNKTC